MFGSERLFSERPHEPKRSQVNLPKLARTILAVVFKIWTAIYLFIYKSTTRIQNEANRLLFESKVLHFEEKYKLSENFSENCPNLEKVSRRQFPSFPSPRSLLLRDTKVTPWFRQSCRKTRSECVYTRRCSHE